MTISIVIRTYNEERHLDALLTQIAAQRGEVEDVEVILVDSGSTDRTLEIAAAHHALVVHIDKSEFTFGRSLNTGCAAANGQILVFISGHCIPADEHWLERLIAPVREGRVPYAYGRQIGGQTTKYSEHQVFEKYFPSSSRVPQEGFFCNNANAALAREVWRKYRFDESLTGLEDLHLARRLIADGSRLGYVADAVVHHIHDESWRQVRLRYEREAVALRHIVPEIHLSFIDFLRYFVGGVVHDMGSGSNSRGRKRFFEIVMFRFCQFWGSYAGNREHRQLSARRREEYFYPRIGNAPPLFEKIRLGRAQARIRGSCEQHKY